MSNQLTIVIPANTFFSTVSQEDADSQAYLAACMAAEANLDCAEGGTTTTTTTTLSCVCGSLTACLMIDPGGLGNIGGLGGDIVGLFTPCTNCYQLPPETDPIPYWDGAFYQTEGSCGEYTTSGGAFTVSGDVINSGSITFDEASNTWTLALYCAEPDSFEPDQSPHIVWLGTRSLAFCDSENKTYPIGDYTASTVAGCTLTPETVKIVGFSCPSTPTTTNSTTTCDPLGPYVQHYLTCYSDSQPGGYPCNNLCGPCQHVAIVNAPGGQYSACCDEGWTAYNLVYDLCLGGGQSYYQTCCPDPLTLVHSCDGDNNDIIECG